jgi:hypothetical protein
MKSNSQHALQIFLASVLLLISCDVSSFAASQQVPTPIPGAINVIVAQTAAAAATQTAALIPVTLTPSLTPFPSQTPADTPTATRTFIFIFPTATNGNDVFSCNLISQSPKDGSSFASNQSFTLDWKIENTGSSAWLQNSVTLNYISGTKFTNKTAVNLPKTITSGSSVTLSINMTAPTQTGDYTTNWTLVAGSQTFCALFLKITVK